MAVYGAGCLIITLPSDSSCTVVVVVVDGDSRRVRSRSPVPSGGSDTDLRRRDSSSLSTTCSRASNSSNLDRHHSSPSSPSTRRFPLLPPVSRPSLSSYASLRSRDASPPFEPVGTSVCWREQAVPRIRQRWQPSSVSNSHRDFLLTHAPHAAVTFVRFGFRESMLRVKGQADKVTTHSS